MTEVVGIIGDRGAGKTCLLTSLLYIDYKLGNKIICNYGVKFPATYMSFSKVAELPESLMRATLGFDELGIGADSRQFFSKRNSSIGKLITQIRKRKCLLYYTVQRLNLIDKRIRQQTDNFILMEKTPKTGRFMMRMINAATGELEYKSLFDGRNFFELYDTNEIIELEGDEDDDFFEG